MFTDNLFFYLFLFTNFFFSLVFIKLNLLRKTKFDIFDPSFAFIVFYFVFFTYNGSFHPKISIYIWLLTFIGGLSFYAGYSLTIKKYIKRNFLFSKSLPLHLYLALSLIIYIYNFFITYIKLNFLDLSFFEVLSSPISVTSQFKTGGYIFYVLTEVSKNLFILISVLYIDKYKSKIFIVIIFSILFYISIFSTSRWNFVLSILIPIYIFNLKNHLSFNKYLVYFFYLSIPTLMIILNLLRHGDFNLESFKLSSSYQESLSGDGNPGHNFVDLVCYLENTHDYHLGKFYYYQLLSFIPRVLWKDKPITSACFYYTKNSSIYDPILDNKTLTYTFFDTYSSFGIPSLIVFSFLIGYMSSILYNKLYSFKSISIFIFSLYFISNYINFLRGSILDAAALLIVSIVSSFLVCYLFRLMFPYYIKSET